MWLFTRHGFYSVVRDTYSRDRDHMAIRARDREHLENLGKLVDSGRIIETPEADYRWRIVVPRRVWLERIMPALAEDVEYTNFKKSVPNDTYDVGNWILHDMWETLYRFQDRILSRRKLRTKKGTKHDGKG